MHACGRTIVGREQRDGTREREIRVGRPQHRAGRRFRLVAEKNSRGFCHPESGSVFVVRKKGEIAGASRLDAGDPVDVQGSVTFQPALEAFGEFSERHGRSIAASRQPPAASQKLLEAGSW
jgi:hypothetical protein